MFQQLLLCSEPTADGSGWPPACELLRTSPRSLRHWPGCRQLVKYPRAANSLVWFKPGAFSSEGLILLLAESGYAWQNSSAAFRQDIEEHVRDGVVAGGQPAWTPAQWARLTVIRRSGRTMVALPTTRFWAIVMCRGCRIPQLKFFSKAQRQ